MSNRSSHDKVKPLAKAKFWKNSVTMSNLEKVLKSLVKETSLLIKKRLLLLVKKW